MLSLTGGGAGGTCPPPRTFLREIKKNVCQNFLVAFMEDNKEDITVAGKMQALLRLLRQRRIVQA